MKKWPLFLLVLTTFLCLLLQPVGAQDGEDEDEGIDVGCGCGGETIDEDDEEKIRKKNVGLAGGGVGKNDDPNAPKVKGSLQERINKAIKAGVAYLKRTQAPNGSFDPVTASRDYKTGKDIGKRYRDELGPTAWAIYTLAKCGVKRSDSSVKRGVKFIMDQTKNVWDEVGIGTGQFGGHTAPQTTSKKPRTTSTYEVAAIIMMIEAVYQKSAKLTGKHKKRGYTTDNPRKAPRRSKIPKEVWKYMHNRIVFLTVGRRISGGGKGRGGKSTRTVPGLQVTKGPNKGGWRYGPGQDGDLSATHFALLALRAASQAGYPVQKVAPKVWTMAAAYVKTCMRPNGGFTYQRGAGKPTGSMTGCGVGCLLICKEQMELAGETPPDWIDGAIKKGMTWLDQNFDAKTNPGHHKHHYYYLYGVERVGDLTGRKEFNGKDWYVRGAQFLLGKQAADGQWVDPTEFPPRDVNSTALALLFLKRATPPTVTLRDDQR